MEIVKPSAEIVNPVPYETMLDTVEHAIRNCYQSQDKIKEGSAEAIIKGCIARSHFSPLEFGDIVVKLVGDRGLMAQITRHRLASFCVSGDTILQSFSSNKRSRGKSRTIRDIYNWYNTPKYHAAFSQLTLRSVDDSFTVVPNKPVKVFFNGIKSVYSVKTESGREIKTTLNHQFLSKNGWEELRDLSVGDSIWVNGKELLGNKDWLYYNYVVLDKTQEELSKMAGCSKPAISDRLRKFNIVKDKKDARLYDRDFIYHNYIELNRSYLDMCAELGCSISTLFKFLKEYGITKDRSKVIKSNSLSNETKKLLNDEDWLRYNYLELNKTRKEVASLAGCCESLVYRAFKKFGIVKPYSDFPNKKPGYGVKGAISDEGRIRIGVAHKGERCHWYKSNREELTNSGGYSEAHKLYDEERNNCEMCGSNEQLEIHHIDKNPRNNNRDNIKILCSACHHLWHRSGAQGAFLDKIISIEYVGEEDVYDIEMEEPYHNYVANGIVVHNCISSTRYCNFSKDKFGESIKVIVPQGLTNESYETWRASVLASEAAYMIMTKDQNMKAEVARSVLPHSLATTIYMKANIREWRTIMNLRCNSHAQTDIRLLMTELLDKMYNLYPVFFEDLYNKVVQQGTLD